MEQIYKIQFNEEMAQLANQQNFALESWQNLLGSKLSNVIDEFLLKTGQSHLQEKFSTAFLKTETFLGSDWTSILEADKYDFLDVFNSQPNNAFSLSTLNSSKIVFQSGEYEFAFTGDNFSVDLQNFASSFANGTVDTDFPTLEALSLIDGFASKIEITDKTTGVNGVPEVSFSFNSPSTDSNVQDAEYWSVNIQGLEIIVHGKLPRDISSILDWMNTGLSIDALFESQGSNIDTVSLVTSTGEKFKVGDDGLNIEFLLALRIKIFPRRRAKRRGEGKLKSISAPFGLVSEIDLSKSQISSFSVRIFRSRVLVT